MSYLLWSNKICFSFLVKLSYPDFDILSKIASISACLFFLLRLYSSSERFCAVVLPAAFPPLCAFIFGLPLRLAFKFSTVILVKLITFFLERSEERRVGKE